MHTGSRWSGEDTVSRSTVLVGLGIELVPNYGKDTLLAAVDNKKISIWLGGTCSERLRSTGSCGGGCIVKRTEGLLGSGVCRSPRGK